MTLADRTELVRQGVDGIVTLAYASSVPGVTPEEDTLRRLLISADHASVSISSLSGLRRVIFFEAQTLCVAQVKMSGEGTESEHKFELVPAERSSRLEAQGIAGVAQPRAVGSHYCRRMFQPELARH